MARDIATTSQLNLWGRAADGFGLEPQRSDLFLVDFTSVAKNVATVANQKAVSIVPQHVRSVNLPEIRTKPAPIRRNSVPVNTPSWDDPLDAVKVAFFLDTNNQEDYSNVTQLLATWTAIVRAGRGSRTQGYGSSGHLLLNADFRMDYAFDVYIYLLRGSQSGQGGFTSDSGTADPLFRDFMARSNTAYESLRRRSAAIQRGPEALDKDYPLAAGAAYAQTGGNVLAQNMALHTVYILRQSWLGGYRVSDLNYTENGLVSVEATLYPEDFETATSSTVTGAAQRLD